MTFGPYIAFIGGAICLGEAIFVIVRGSRTLAHRSFVAGMLLLAIESIFNGLSQCELSLRSIEFWQTLSLSTRALLPGVWLLFSLSYSRGNHREFIRRWRWTLGLAFAVPILVTAWSPSVSLVRVQLLPAMGSALNENYVLIRSSKCLFMDGVMTVSSVLILVNLETTFRAAVGTMRWQVKFMILGLAVHFVIRIYLASQALIYSSLPLGLVTVHSCTLIGACLLIARSLTRGKVFSVDIYPSQKLIYVSLTVILTGIYLTMVGALASLVQFLGGAGGVELQSFMLILAILGLAVLGASDRLHQKVKLFVSRNLKRSVYDYRQIWTSFTERTSSLVDEVDLSRAVVNMVSQTFDVLSVSIWLIEPDRSGFRFAASTALTETSASEAKAAHFDMERIVAELGNQATPQYMDEIKKEWAEQLKSLTPLTFRTGGRAMIVPLISRGDLLGLMTLGDRVGGVGFSLEDIELLQCLGDQTANDLLNLNLSQKLLQAKQMEAFQTVSAFFVHDLKNTTSSLSLTLRNLPVHFDDPDFRKDALRAISNSVNHLNELIGRLSALRQEVKLKLVEADLNEVTGQGLATLDKSRAAVVSVSQGVVPNVRMDVEQIQKVVVNLVLNALEAIPKDGKVSLSTGVQEGFAQIAVSDTGCGMSSEFMRNSLFRPFQTTKKNGTGIGMFQSKVIVEAHKGRIEVESTQGVGTVFRVLLPILSKIQ